VQARYDYDPYGRRTKATGGLDADLGFTGHFAHAASGLALAVYRSYDASTGRWLSRDPIGLRGGVNLYGYAENRPISSLDPLGLACVNWGQAAVSLLSGVIVGAAIAVVLGVALSALAIPAGLLFAVKLGFIIGGLLGTASAAGSAYYQFKAGCTNQAFNTLGMIIGGALVGMTFAGTAGLRPPAGGRGGAGPVLQGQAGVQKAITTIQAAGGRIRGQQVSVIAANGVRTIIDLVVMFGGRLVFIEVKNGLGAVLRPGQALALPSVATSGGTGVGANAAAAGLLGPIPPTPVGVINVFPWP
jgi:RHS repeat-associated protein